MIGAVIAVLFIGLQVAAFIALVVVSWLYFDRRYKARKDGSRHTVPDPGFEPTAEVFIDPKENRRYRVYFNPASGDRQYVEEPLP